MVRISSYVVHRLFDKILAVIYEQIIIKQRLAMTICKVEQKGLNQ